MELVLCGIFGDETIDKINVEVPGTHVEALTSASSLIQELEFSKVGFEDNQKIENEKRANGGVLPEKHVQDPNDYESNAKKEEIRNKIAADEEKEKATKVARDLIDVKGIMHVKAEWKDKGPKMPPIRHEDLFNKPRAPKNQFDFE